MPSPQRIPLSFGAGLDRETGVMALRQPSFEDLRNVVLFDGKATVRKGFVERLTFGSSTHILAVQPVRTYRTMIVVAYDSATGDVDVWGADAAATTATLIGTWFTKTTDLTVPPIVSTTEVYARVFLAHATPSVTDRADTYVYDRGSSPQLRALTADLDRDGTAEPMKFRGVSRHLKYLTGWGYGSEKDQERPEILRVSKPGEPESFDPEHYFIVGDRRAPIVTAKPAFDTLVVFKEEETHQIYGYDRFTFGERMLDELFGCTQDRLAVSVSGLVFFWSSHGPRVTDGATPSRDAAVPLDYFGFDPETLVAEGALENAFVVYEPIRRMVLFVFGQRVYALSIRGGLPNARWSYWEIDEFTPLCGGVVFQGDSGTFPAPTGFPSCNAFDGSAGTTIQYTWDNNSQDGDEFIEIWTLEVANLVADWLMDTDGGGGVAEGFQSTTDAAHTVTYSIDSSAQKIALTASTAAGVSYVYEDAAVVVGDDYMFVIEAQIANLVGTAKASITIEWIDSGGPTTISTETEVDVSGASFGVFKIEGTCPASADTARIRCQVHSLASGDTIDAWFKMSVLHQSSTPAWVLDQTANVSLAASQTVPITPTVGGKFYRIRSRYGRGVDYTAGYTSGDPDDWPDTSECYGLASPGALQALYVAYWMSNAPSHSAHLLFAVEDAVWAAMQADGANSGFRIDRDGTGSGPSNIMDLLADKSNPPHSGVYTTNWEDVAHFGYDEKYAGTHGQLQVGPIGFGIKSVNGLTWFAVDDLVHGFSAIDVSYRVTPYIGGQDLTALTRVRYMGPEHEPEEAALGLGPVTAGGGAGNQPTGGGPLSFAAVDAGTTGDVTVSMTHSDWFWQWAQDCYCDQDGFCLIDENDHYHGAQREIVPQFLVQYRNPGGTGGWTDDADGWQDCAGGGPGPNKLVLSSKTTATGTGGSVDVRVKYRFQFRPNASPGIVEGPPSDLINLAVT